MICHTFHQNDTFVLGKAILFIRMIHLYLGNIARSEQSSHTPGSSHQRLYHFQRKDKIVEDFIILNQVVAEKTLMKIVHMCYIGVTDGKIENMKKEGKMRISILIIPRLF